MKKCTVCEGEKELEEFFNSKASKDGKSYRCRACDTKAVLSSRKENLDGFRKTQRIRDLKKKYGVGVGWYMEILESQEYCCAICKVKQNTVAGESGLWSFAVDHCHNSGKPRGLLCNRCNRALGLFRDSAETLEAALNYLKEHRQ